MSKFIVDSPRPLLTLRDARGVMIYHAMQDGKKIVCKPVVIEGNPAVEVYVE
jgi:hypothetical protein